MIESKDGAVKLYYYILIALDSIVGNEWSLIYNKLGYVSQQVCLNIIFFKPFVFIYKAYDICCIFRGA